jgi:hypothetical protein
MVESLANTTDYLPGLLVYLVVPCLVWATVIAGLIFIVRDKMEEEDIVDYLVKHDANGWDANLPASTNACYRPRQHDQASLYHATSTAPSPGTPQLDINERSRA